MKWKIGDKVISNIGLDKNENLTIIDIIGDKIFFSDGQNTTIGCFGEKELVHINRYNWKNRYGGKK